VPYPHASASALAASGQPGGAPPPPGVVDVRVLAARGTQPQLSWYGPDDAVKVVPPVRDATTGLTPVGSFQDDAGVVYSRPALRVLFPTDSPATDVGEPADPHTWCARRRGVRVLCVCACARARVCVLGGGWGLLVY
jgi:hypothetical protein